VIIPNPEDMVRCNHQLASPHIHPLSLWPCVHRTTTRWNCCEATATLATRQTQRSGRIRLRRRPIESRWGRRRAMMAEAASPPQAPLATESQRGSVNTHCDCADCGNGRYTESEGLQSINCGYFCRSLNCAVSVATDTSIIKRPRFAPRVCVLCVLAMRQKRSSCHHALSNCTSNVCSP
jgi:hypothetical protein